MGSSINLMERNFVSQESRSSHYLEAMEAAAQARKNVSITRQNSILQAGIAACAAARTMGERILEAKKAGRNMMFEGQTATAEASERNLDEIKEHIEEKAKEALEALGNKQEAATTTEEEASGQKTQGAQRTDNAATPPASQDTEGSATAAPPSASAPATVLPTPTATPTTGMKINIVV